MWAVLKKEFKSYFLTPIGYVFIGLFLAIFSLIFYITTIYQGASTFQYVFGYIVMYGVVFLMPLLTMRMFAEERKNGTEQLLITSPRSMVEITLGKFFAGVLVTVIAELLTFVYFGILCVFKTPDVPATLTAMFGFLLISMAYIAFGMFMSSLTENQIVAGVITIAAFILTWIAPTVTSGLESLSLMAKFSSFLSGVFSITQTIQMLLITTMFVILTMIVMKRRKLVK